MHDGVAACERSVVTSRFKEIAEDEFPALVAHGDIRPAYKAN
jgi:hypothetical protein